MDLSYSPITRYQLRLPRVSLFLSPVHSKNFDILDDENLLNVDDQTVRSLNGRRVTDTILKLVPNRNVSPFFYLSSADVPPRVKSLSLVRPSTLFPLPH